MEDELAAIGEANGMACIGAALIASDDINILGKKIDDLPFALVAPLRAEYDGIRHG
jgi:hypothetical protein